MIIILGCTLACLTYTYIRQRIMDRRNEELNRTEVKETRKKVRKTYRICDELSILPKELETLRFIGFIEEYEKTPQNGDIGMHQGSNYFFYEGKWHRFL